MSQETIQKAIRIMQRSDYYRLRNWDQPWLQRLYPVVQTEQALRERGGRACFLGCIAIGPEFQRDGGLVDMLSGLPVIAHRDTGEWLSGVAALEHWLGLEVSLVRDLCFGRLDGQQHELFASRFSDVYQKPTADVTHHDVVTLLQHLLEIHHPSSGLEHAHQ